jgi:outer membrane protein assembly factor BamB
MKILCAHLSVALGVLLSSTACGENWPQFRGPTGLGYSTEQNLALKWNGKSGENIAWRAPLPKSDNPYSSPIVWGERVLVTCVTNRPLTHHLLCFDTADGRVVWETMLDPGPLHLTDLRGGYGAPTPCTDGDRIYVAFGSAVLAAFDFAGQLAWRKELTNYAFDVALGSSPVLYRDLLILDCDQTGKSSSIIAFDKATGKIRWEVKRPETGFAHSTPVIVNIDRQPQMLVSASAALQALDPADGRTLWWCPAQGDASSPAFGEGLVYSDSGRGGKAVCVDPTGQSGAIAPKWVYPQIPEGLSSAIIAAGRVWRTHNPGIMKCIALATGELAFSDRFPGVSTWASPIATSDGRLYFVSAGKTYVLKASDKLEILATNEIGEEDRASAAVSAGRIFVRGGEHLYCIQNK